MLIDIEKKFKKLMQMKPSDVRGHVEQAQKELVKGAAEGDPRIWHRILMAIMLAFVGICLIGSIFVEFLLDMQAERLQNGMPIVHSEINTKLPPGNYRVYGLLRDGESTDEIQNLFWMVTSEQGGALVGVKAPAGTIVPKDFAIPSGYHIKVNDNGAWEFQPIASGDKQKTKEVRPATGGE